MTQIPIKFPHIFPINIDRLDAVRRDDGHIWGYEVWLVNDKEHDLGCKLLVIFPGFVSSKHNHETKYEYFIILAGELKLACWNDGPDNKYEEHVLESGEQCYIDERIYHRFETGTREFTLLLEVSGFENELTDKLEPSRQLY